MPNTVDLILNALTGIRGQILGYHQSRSQVFVFLTTTAVVAVTVAFSNSDKEWAPWFVLIAPNVLLVAELSMIIFFRQLLDWAQRWERELLRELETRSKTDATSVPPPAIDSAIYYSRHLKVPLMAPDEKGQIGKVPTPYKGDLPQSPLWFVVIGYALFSIGWFIFHIPSNKDKSVQINEATIVSVGDRSTQGWNMKLVMVSCPFAKGSYDDPGTMCEETVPKRPVSKLTCDDFKTGLLLVVGGVDRTRLTAAGAISLESNIQLAHQRALTIQRQLEGMRRNCPESRTVIVAVPRGPEMIGIDDADRTVRVYKAPAD